MRTRPRAQFDYTVKSLSDGVQRATALLYPDQDLAMAKGLRSSVKKANKAKLRSRVFRPVEDARTERLSAKLLELASKPQTEREKEEKTNDPTKG